MRGDPYRYLGLVAQDRRCETRGAHPAQGPSGFDNLASTPSPPQCKAIPLISSPPFAPWSHKPAIVNRHFGNCKIGGCKETHEPFANPFAKPVPTLRQPFANLSPTLCQPFLPTPLQAPLSVQPRHAFRTRVNGFLVPPPTLFCLFPFSSLFILN